MAAINGVDLDENEKNETQEAFDRAARRAEAVIRGESVADVERRTDADVFGLEFEVEE